MLQVPITWGSIHWWDCDYCCGTSSLHTHAIIGATQGPEVSASAMSKRLMSNRGGGPIGFVNGAPPHLQDHSTFFSRHYSSGVVSCLQFIGAAANSIVAQSYCWPSLLMLLF